MAGKTIYDLFPLRVSRSEKYVRIECDVCNCVILAGETMFLADLCGKAGVDQLSVLIGSAVLFHRHGAAL